MSGVEVTITGILYDKVNRTTQNVTLIGEAILTGLEVGGGPVLPGRPDFPGFPERPEKPPGVWPSPGRPTHPIYRPGPGGNRPVDPGWGVDEGAGIPPKPEEPPPGNADKPPPEDGGGWGFVSEWSRWGYFPAEDEAQPK